MNPVRKRRLIMIGLIVLAAATATTLALSAFRENLLYFFSPADVKAGKVPAGQLFRLGGVVLEGSFKREQGSLRSSFVVTDRFENIPVRFEGILPDLFREGQSVIALGKLGGDGEFSANEVLAKHDETYMPKEVADAIAKGKARKASQDEPGSAAAGE